MEDAELITKAKSRIKKMIATGKRQPRCRKIDDNTYEYKVEHHVKSLFFKADSLGRLRLVT
jgi:hypothetical protein